MRVRDNGNFVAGRDWHPSSPSSSLIVYNQGMTMRSQFVFSRVGNDKDWLLGFLVLETLSEQHQSRLFRIEGVVRIEVLVRIRHVIAAIHVSKNIAMDERTLYVRPGETVDRYW